MNVLTTPRAEQVVELGRGRRMAWTEFGTSAGRPIVWFHGTPGGGRQIPQSLRRAVQDHDVRLIVVERPGYGRSSPHRYGQIRDVTADIEHLLDAVGVERFGLAALSGGGPYALACAHDFADRVVGVAVLGGVVPHVGPEAVEGGWVATMAPLAGIADRFHLPIGLLFSGMIRLMDPVAGPVFKLTARMFPEGDRDVFAQPDMQAMFIDDLRRSARGGLAGPALDLSVFVRDWGFRLADVTVPVHFWQGDADPIVTVEQARRMAEIVPRSTFNLRPGESHLGGFAIATEAVEAVLGEWTSPSAARRRSGSRERSPASEPRPVGRSNRPR